MEFSLHGVESETHAQVKPAKKSINRQQGRGIFPPNFKNPDRLLGNSKPSDGGDFAGTSMKWQYEQEEKQPGDIGEWLSELVTENKGQADYYIDAIKWMKSNHGSLDSPKYIAKLLKQDLAAFSSKQPSSFLLLWSERAERIIHAKSIAEPVTEDHKPDWLTNTPMFKCVIEGNEVVVKWDSEHPVIKHNKQNGEVVRFRWK